jgi:S-adenosylmethionine:tRNA ribosyltransferase-isomerase
LNTTDFDYDLPDGFIAQTPTEPRDAARLLVLDRKTGDNYHAVFKTCTSTWTPAICSY